MERKTEFIQFLNRQVQLKKSRQDVDAIETEKKFYDLLEKEMSTREKINAIGKKIDTLIRNFRIIDKQTIARSYKRFGHLIELEWESSEEEVDVKDGVEKIKELIDFRSSSKYELGQNLIFNYRYCEFYQKNEKIGLACKYSIIQMESILNYFKPQIIDSIMRKGNKIDKEYLNKRNGNLDFRALYKKGHLLFFGGKFSWDKIDKVYQGRNYVSHGLFNDQQVENKKALDEIKKSPNEYFAEVDKYIETALKKL